MKRSILHTILAALVLPLLLAACTKSAPAPQTPDTNPPAPPVSNPNPAPNPSDPGQTDISPAEADVAVRLVLQAYLEALKQGNYEAAAALWSPGANVHPDDLKNPGVTDWFFQSSEMIDATPDTAFVQLNFAVAIASGTATPYVDGRNARFVRLARTTDGQWQIQSMTTSP